MTKKILITGATGLIGKQIIDSLITGGDEIIVLTQNILYARKKIPKIKKFFSWNNYLSLSAEPIDAIINLAGTNLGDKRWTDNFKSEIYNSRIQSTNKIVRLIESMKTKPEVLINASGVDYYGDTGNKDINEDSPFADSFISHLVRDWEAEAMEAEKFNVRVVLLRTGFVNARQSKALQKMILPFKLFLGGYAGSGNQFISWIDIEDIAGIYLFCLNNYIRGPVNASSPNPVTMKDFSCYLGKILHRPCWLHIPGLLIKLLFGEASNLILDGRRALPEKLLQAGYKFKFENLFNSLNVNLG